MFGLGSGEIFLILIIVLVLFGAGRLPEVGAGLAKGIRNFKKSLNDDQPAEKPIESVNQAAETTTEPQNKTASTNNG